MSGLVNPRYDEVLGRPCLDSLDDIEDPVDLVLMGVGDRGVEEQLTRAASRGDRSAVVFGSLFEPDDPSSTGIRDRVAATARAAGMALCGGGCMGFVNNALGVRALGYLEPNPLPAGGVSLVTHSGSAFSTLLRARRGFGYRLAVSSGQELVTDTADYVEYALADPGTRLVALMMESPRAAPRLQRGTDQTHADGARFRPPRSSGCDQAVLAQYSRMKWREGRGSADHCRMEIARAPTGTTWGKK